MKTNTSVGAIFLAILGLLTGSVQAYAGSSVQCSVKESVDATPKIIAVQPGNGAQITTDDRKYIVEASALYGDLTVTVFTAGYASIVVQSATPYKTLDDHPKLVLFTLNPWISVECL